MTIAVVLWAFAEATLFFIVPDMLLTMIAVRSPAAGFAACAYAVAGALPGGLIMYVWGRRDAAAATAALERIPAVRPADIDAVERRFDRSGLPSMIAGPLLGTPYKIYAVAAGARRMSLLRFLILSVPARTPRFVAVTALAAWAGADPIADWSFMEQELLLIAIWVVFYSIYFCFRTRPQSDAIPITQ